MRPTRHQDPRQSGPNQDLGQNKENICNVFKWMFTKDVEGPNRARIGLLKSIFICSYILILEVGLLIVTARTSLLAKARDRKDDGDLEGSTVSLLGSVLARPCQA